MLHGLDWIDAELDRRKNCEQKEQGQYCQLRHLEWHLRLRRGKSFEGRHLLEELYD